MSDNEDVSTDDEVDAGLETASSPWVPYNEREEWRDVVPVEQDDGPNPIVAIAYSDQCKGAVVVDVFDEGEADITSVGRLRVD